MFLTPYLHHKYSQTLQTIIKPITKATLSITQEPRRGRGGQRLPTEKNTNQNKSLRLWLQNSILYQEKQPKLLIKSTVILLWHYNNQINNYLAIILERIKVFYLNNTISSTWFKEDQGQQGTSENYTMKILILLLRVLRNNIKDGVDPIFVLDGSGE